MRHIHQLSQKNDDQFANHKKAPDEKVTFYGYWRLLFQIFSISHQTLKPSQNFALNSETILDKYIVW